MAEDGRLPTSQGDWSTAAQDPVAWYSTVCGAGCRFMAVWEWEEGKTAEYRQTKRAVEEADKVAVASWGKRRKLEIFHSRVDWMHGGSCID